VWDGTSPAVFDTNITEYGSSNVRSSHGKVRSRKVGLNNINNGYTTVRDHHLCMRRLIPQHCFNSPSISHCTKHAVSPPRIIVSRPVLCQLIPHQACDLPCVLRASALLAARMTQVMGASLSTCSTLPSPSFGQCNIQPNPRDPVAVDRRRTLPRNDTTAAREYLLAQHAPRSEALPILYSSQPHHQVHHRAGSTCK
jgi:hypothetical protein